MRNSVVGTPTYEKFRKATPVSIKIAFVFLIEGSERVGVFFRWTSCRCSCIRDVSMYASNAASFRQSKTCPAASKRSFFVFFFAGVVGDFDGDAFPSIRDCTVGVSSMYDPRGTGTSRHELVP